MTFKPAPENHGYKFKRIDLKEHLLLKQMLLMLQIHNEVLILKKMELLFKHQSTYLLLGRIRNRQSLIELDASEPPIMDGSSKFFVEALEKAGIENKKHVREEYVVKEVISYTDEESGSEIILMPADEYQVTTMVDFGTKVLGTQNASIKHISDFKKEISDSRTFSFLHEIEMLLEHGLIKGGDLK